jgi:hypothetical protein
MKTISKIIFRISVLIIGIWIVTPLLRWVFDLEFASSSIKSNYERLLFFAVPIATILSLFGTLRSKDDDVRISIKIFVTLLLSLGSIFIMTISMFGDMCTWTNKEVLYEQKKDRSTKIIIQDFGCGATDTQPPTTGVYKVEEFTKYFIRSVNYDTLNMDKNEWIKIE